MFTLQRYSNRRNRLSLESLEDRWTPAQFGVPWSDPMHLTASFAPNGTTAMGISSTLYATMDPQMPRVVWQTAILRAMQTWSEVSNVNVGLMMDGGQPFNISGPSAGDPRFGDIRIGALPMTPDAFAEAVPPSPFLTDSLAGDIFFNSNVTFTPANLYGVALHETGHALGLGPSLDPRSVMYNVFNQNFTLSASDVAAIRSLYGSRGPDLNEGAKGNQVLKNATRIHYSAPSGTYTGTTPSVAYGDVTTRTDVDFYSFENLLTYSGSMTFRLQTKGISLLAPRLTLFNAKGVQLAQATGSGNLGSVVTLTLPTTVRGAKYYLRVEASPSATFGVGRYGLAVTLNGLAKPTALSVDQVLRGPYDTLDGEDLGEIFTNPAAFYSDDLHQDDQVVFATKLDSTPGYAAGTRFAAIASLSDSADVDFYSIRMPRIRNQSFVLTVAMRTLEETGSAPLVDVFNGNLARLPVEILANGNGTYRIQVQGLLGNQSYYLRVAGAMIGNYGLEATVGSRAIPLRTLTSGSVALGSPQTANLYVARTELFGLLLSASGNPGSVAHVMITNSAGQTVFNQTVAAGQVVSGTSTLLAPGTFRVVVTVIAGSGPVNFAIKGDVLTDPIGPQPSDSALAPEFQAPPGITDPPPSIPPDLLPFVYFYPNGVLTLDPYLWDVWAAI